MNAMLRRGAAAAPRSVVVAGLTVVALGVVAGCHLLPGSGTALVQQLAELLRHSGAGGAVLFLLLEIAAVLSGGLPASLLGVAAGAIFGLLPGFALAAVGVLTGATLAFALSRSAFRPRIEGMLATGGRLHRIDAAVARYGWRSVALIRLSPIVPFSAASYLLGLSSVGFTGYLGGTLAALPGLFGYVFCGTLADAGIAALSGGGPLRWVPLGVGAAATLVGIVVLGRLLVRAPLSVRSAGGAGV